jgi:D-arabinose 1-dehydrogenase-like Zn-dependent alcohol dehydrogenase
MTIMASEAVILGSRATTKVELADVVEIVGRGGIKPIVSETFPLEQAEHVHDLLREGRIIGRAVLQI